MNKFFLFFILLTSYLAHGQSVGINATGAAPNPAAMLDVSSTVKGFMPPRMTSADRIAIATPMTSNGLIVFDTGSQSLWVIQNGAWVNLGVNWSINGNANTGPANFIGTTDGNDLRFKVNNVPSGIIKNTGGVVGLGKNALGNNVGVDAVAIGTNALKDNQGSANIAIGSEALSKNTLGNFNVAIGSNAMLENTIGNRNTAVGYIALKENFDGLDNVAVGGWALTKNTSGNINSAFGVEALGSNTSGSYNLATGYQSLTTNSIGFNNVAYGIRALQFNTTGANNLAIGNFALQKNTVLNGLVAIGDSSLFNNGTGAVSIADGTSNTAVGYKTLLKNTRGYSNSGFGNLALYSNTSGDANTGSGASALYNSTSGDNNTANGADALYANESGSNNTSIGAASLYYNLDGGDNTAHGFDALLNNISGNGNTGIGSSALFTNDIGTYNTALGYGADVALSDLDNATAIGSYASVGCSNCMTLGSINGVNFATSNVKVGIGTSTPSNDMHIKQIVESYPTNTSGGLRLERKISTNYWNAAIDAGNDFNFFYNGTAKAFIDDGTGNYISVSDARMKKNVTSLGTMLPAIMLLKAKTYHYLDNDATSPLSYGFIAQEVEKLFPDFVITKGDENMKAIAYQNFGVIAIKAIQEQQLVIEALQKENNSIIASNESLKKMLVDQVKSNEAIQVQNEFIIKMLAEFEINKNKTK
jgi:trimeric autotransporter adhesin